MEDDTIRHQKTGQIYRKKALPAWGRALHQGRYIKSMAVTTPDGEQTYSSRHT